MFRAWVDYFLRTAILSFIKFRKYGVSIKSGNFLCGICAYIFIHVVLLCGNRDFTCYVDSELCDVQLINKSWQSFSQKNNRDKNPSVNSDIRFRVYAGVLWVAICSIYSFYWDLLEAGLYPAKIIISVQRIFIATMRSIMGHGTTSDKINNVMHAYIMFYCTLFTCKCVSNGVLFSVHEM